MDTPSYYAIIPASVRYADIPANAKLLYGEISALTQKEGFCWASNQYFADLYKCKSHTVSEWVSALIKAGFLRIEVNVKAGNKRKIWLLDPIRQIPETYPVKTVDPYPVKTEHNNTSDNTTTTTAFCEFWKEYPNKVSKPQALKAWIKNKPVLADVLSGLSRWKSSKQWAKDGGQYIPHASTWLNGERWKDNPEPEKTKASSDPWGPNYNPLEGGSW